MKGYKHRKGAPQCGLCECGDHAWAGVRNGMVTLVDQGDAHFLERQWWRVSDCGYAIGQGNVLHREIVRPAEGFIVDHKNHARLDNRRRNLRACTTSQNNANRKRLDVKNKSGFRGVHAFNGRWRAKISVDDKTVNLGMADTPEEAARMYDREAIAAFGEFARLNFPNEAA